MPKPKRINKTKEQILATMQSQARAEVNRKFVREKFFPALCEASDNINDADIFLQSFSSMVMESFLSMKKEKKFSDLKLEEKLDSKSPKYEALKNVIAIFNTKGLQEAEELIDGMKEEIRMYYREEMKTRSLSTLKTKWYE